MADYKDCFASPEKMGMFPYSSVGYLRYWGFDDEKRVYRNFRATAFYANLEEFYPPQWQYKKNVILTSAHCLVQFDDKKGEFVYSEDIKFYPAAYSDSNGELISKHGTFQQLQGGEGVAYFIHPGFMDLYNVYSERPKYDIAAILLDKNEKGEELFDVVEPLNLVLLNYFVQPTTDDHDFADLNPDDVNIPPSPGSDDDVDDDIAHDLVPNLLVTQTKFNSERIKHVFRDNTIMVTAIGYPTFPSSTNQLRLEHIKMRICPGLVTCSDMDAQEGIIKKSGGANGGCSGDPWIIKFDGNFIGVIGITAHGTQQPPYSLSPQLTSEIINGLFQDVYMYVPEYCWLSNDTPCTELSTPDFC